MADAAYQNPDLLELQAPKDAPEPQAFVTRTNPVLPPVSIVDRMDHFPDGVYSLEAESHLMRLAKVILGDSGAGQLRKRFLNARFQGALSGAHSLDLDRFWGAIFGLPRMVEERPALDASIDLGDDAEWLDANVQDSTYRSRIEQFSRAVTYGATPIGMELVAEALLGVDCDIIEGYVQADQTFYTYGDLEAVTYLDLEAFTYGQLDGTRTIPPADQGVLGAGQQGIIDRNLFTVRPKRQITEEERRYLIRVLEKLKPAHARVAVDDSGMALHVPLEPRGVFADSEFWDITMKVVPNSDGYTRQVGEDGLPIEQPRPAGALYQGEAWSYISSFNGVIAYAVKPNGDVIPDNVQQIRYGDRTVVYSASRGILSLLDLLSGRSVSEGVISSQPYPLTRPQTTFGFDDWDIRRNQQLVLSPERTRSVEESLFADQNFPLYIDRLPIRDVIRQISLSVASDPSEHLHRMWATPERASTDVTVETLMVQMTSPKLVNHYSLEVSRYPHRLVVSADVNGQWTEVHRSEVRESLPSVISTLVAEFSGQHPQHGFSGHWKKVSFDTPPLQVSRIKVEMTRLNDSPPQTPGGKKIPYSLAVRNLDVGYRVRTFADIPNVGGTASIAQGHDILGSIVTYTPRVMGAQGIMDRPSSPWQSEPQPISDAVVNFYMDMRDETGEGQLVDRFFIDPLHPGVHAHLYWSNDVATGDVVEASDDPLRPGEYEPNGTVFVNQYGLKFVETDPAYIDVDAKALQIDYSQPWWIGIEILPEFAHSTSINRPIIDLAGNLIEFDNGVIRFTTMHSESIELGTYFSAGESVLFAVAHLPEDTSELAAGVYLFYRSAEGSGVVNFVQPLPMSLQGTGEASVQWAAGLRLDVASTALTTPLDLELEFPIRIGGQLEADPGVSGFTLVNLVLKEEEFTQEAIAGFISTPTKYTVKPQWRGDPERLLTNNAALRFNRALVSADVPHGLFGGPGDIYSNLEWTPIPRDFLVERGYLHIAPVKAKFWKFEFTHLAPIVSDLLFPGVRVIRTMDPLKTSTPNSNGDQSRWINEVGLDYQINDPGFSHVDNVQLKISQADSLIDPLVGYLPTQSLVARDLNVYSEMSASVALRTQEWQRKHVSPLHVMRGRHQYLSNDYIHNSKVSYVVGIKELIPFRLDYTADDDTMVYRDLFWDAENLQPGFTWEFNPGALKAGGATQVAESKVFESRKSVAAIQFATQQSPASQMIPNDDFSDPSMIEYAFDDDNGWHKIGDANLSYNLANSSVTVSRDAVPVSRFLPRTGGLVQRPVSPVFAWRSIEVLDEESSDASTGGIESQAILVGDFGRIHVAAKVLVSEVPDSPLLLQIVDDSDDSVLVSKVISPHPGVVLEDFASLTLDGSFSGVKIRVIQSGVANNDFEIIRASLFDDGIVWEWSVDGGETWVYAYDVRNNPHGIVQFAQPGTSLCYRVVGSTEGMTISSIQIRPWYNGSVTPRYRHPQFGANISPYDQYPPIEEDPDFQIWNKPIPRWWWNISRLGSFFAPESPTTSGSHFYGRTVEETVAAPIDVASRVLSVMRVVDQSIAGMEDEVSRELELGRGVGETLGAMSDEADWLVFEGVEAVVRTLVSPPT